ncbi:MAG: hypothetical protein QOF73_4606 [Thermomicrobiales bacterium]|jgi:hypothetical protein|nr:hypothetical protein [Thermomicrobiales bacterium]
MRASRVVPFVLLGLLLADCGDPPEHRSSKQLLFPTEDCGFTNRSGLPGRHAIANAGQVGGGGHYQVRRNGTS